MSCQRGPRDRAPHSPFSATLPSDSYPLGCHPWAEAHSGARSDAKVTRRMQRPDSGLRSALRSAVISPIVVRHPSRPHPQPLAALSLHEGRPCSPPQMCCCLSAHAEARYHAVLRPQPLAVSPPCQGRPPPPSRAFRTPVTLAALVAATTLELGPNTSTQP
ncbi:hypothetical protein NDU88_003013 [Pleurodeles waltl]|uniref:Uncharacterized protein n=1 Tax=Pleurodeles waltl TaxID=8319 RepID=A0AAV7WMW2_PLEWA|nr:hypothetical protein NDU88_003013 [Pleurodeles waltl]